MAGGDGKHYEVENGPSVDRFAQVDRGVNYGWNDTDASMAINAIYNWNPAHAPVNITFVQSATFGGSQFPASKQDHAFVSESGPTYATGPAVTGQADREISTGCQRRAGRGPTTFVEYVGTGKGTVVGLAAGPDGLYFTELYKDQNAVTPIDAGAARIACAVCSRWQRRFQWRRQRRRVQITSFGGRRSERPACWRIPAPMATAMATSTRTI